jgi:Asp-tRNA(Asn)/Glu-tRNA(Gln) amidotransferase A subunit family amidase
VDDAGRSTRFRDVRETIEGTLEDTTIDLRNRNAHRAGIQQTMMHCMMVLDLDAITYPTGNIPPTLIKGIVEPDVNGRSPLAWNVLGQMGFPAMTVPAGFVPEAYDRVPDEAAEGGTRLEGPTAVRLPVGIDFATMPFNEAMLFQIASAYEAATQHRAPPPAFGPIEEVGDQAMR